MATVVRSLEITGKQSLARARQISGSPLPRMDHGPVIIHSFQKNQTKWSIGIISLTYSKVRSPICLYLSSRLFFFPFKHLQYESPGQGTVCVCNSRVRYASKYTYLLFSIWAQCYVCDLTVLRVLSFRSALAHCLSTKHHQSRFHATKLCAACVCVCVHTQVCVCKFSRHLHSAPQDAALSSILWLHEEWTLGVLKGKTFAENSHAYYKSSSLFNQYQGIDKAGRRLCL